MFIKITIKNKNSKSYLQTKRRTSISGTQADFGYHNTFLLLKTVTNDESKRKQKNLFSLKYIAGLTQITQLAKTK